MIPQVRGPLVVGGGGQRGPIFVGGGGGPWAGGPAGGPWGMMRMMGWSMSMMDRWRYWRAPYQWGSKKSGKKGKKSKKSKKGKKGGGQWRGQPWSAGGWGSTRLIGLEDDYDVDVLVIDSTYVFDAGYGKLI